MTSPEGIGPTQPSPGARAALALLLLINLFNYLDRQVLAAVEVQIEETFFPRGDIPREPAEQALIEGQLGSLQTAFLLSYMFLAPLFGWLGDRMARWVLVGVGVILWSLASGGSGLAPMFALLFFTRCLVGVGEAAYGPVAPTMIADYYPLEKRGSKLAWFYVAIPVGSALGYVLGGFVASEWGWRWAFFVVVPPGIILGMICFFMNEPQRELAKFGQNKRKVSWKSYLNLLRIPSYTLNTLGMTAMTFAMGALSFWLPRYASQVRGAGTLAEVNTNFGIIVVVTGLCGTLAGGWLGDRLKPRFPGSYFLVSGIAMFVGFPLVLAVLYVDFPLAWWFLGLACFCLFFNTGPTNTILANVTHPSMRASGFAFNILIIHALGDAISPPLIGVINGYSSMHVGFLVVSSMFVVAGIFWLWGIRYLDRDTELAATRG